MRRTGGWSAGIAVVRVVPVDGKTSVAASGLAERD